MPDEQESNRFRFSGFWSVDIELERITVRRYKSSDAELQVTNWSWRDKTRGVPRMGAPLRMHRPAQPAMIGCFSLGILFKVEALRFRWDSAISGGMRAIQLLSEKSRNRGALNISRNTTSVFPVFSI